MKQPRQLKRIILGGAAAALVVSACAMAGCQPQAAPSPHGEDVVQATDDTVLRIPEVNPNEPIIRDYGDGVFVQRTPSEDISPTQNASAPFHHPSESVPYNTYFLKADARGCNACHEDLTETVKRMPYGHVNLPQDLGIETSVQMCLDCHNTNDFGSIIHGLHATDNKATCMNCHDATETLDATSNNANGSNSGMPLWDVVKHQRLRGILDIPADQITGEFAYRQDETLPGDTFFDISWQNAESDYERIRKAKEGVETDSDTFDNWTITISGAVDHEKTWTLAELIAAAPSETFVTKEQCMLNPIGGPLITQVEMTGIPVDWLFDQVGLSKDAVAVTLSSADSALGGVNFSNHTRGEKAYIVYEIDGKRLEWEQGFPAIYCQTGASAMTMWLQLSDIIVETEEINENLGVCDANGVKIVRPNVGLFNLREGQIVKTGETFQFHGYADDKEKAITAIEVSMDRGQTWKRFDTPDTDIVRWVTWTLDFTPEVDGAYCLYLRSINEDGTVTPEPQEKMIVAKSEMPEVK